MAKITFDGNPVTTLGDLPAVGTQAPEFTLTGADLGEVKLSDFVGKRIVLNIFPSLDTGICAQSVREFNKLGEQFDNTVVIAVSMDLPFAHDRFCAAEGIENVVTGSAFRSSFPQDYEVLMIDGPLSGLLSRAVVIIDENGKVTYTEQVPEGRTEPNYEGAKAALS
ncbi:thiol peroxidase [Trueperella bonasi]|uniref:Thiol peroxidase n=1 Tax=Trueperella bonasi TaxID=312286 RepID=A0ABT9NGS9_9ACTO|nr:thiol peroxidase [Trueperella bonasi]MDP9806575.1 thiol peroxidase [Trueperella bonasi]